MDGSSNIVAFAFLWLFTLSNVDLCICRASSDVLCIPSEREALLKMKHHLSDPSDRLASWSANGDCCNWASVVCNNITGHILELHLSTSPPFEFEDSVFETLQFGGEVYSSLLDLKHLCYLDLSGNDFGGMQIPVFLGSMISLTYLNLSHARFGGSIPLQFWNLSNLIYLDLRGNNFGGSIPHQIGNLSNLHYLDLRFNIFGGNIPHQIGKLSNLHYLDLGNNYFNGSITHQIGNLSNLIHLHVQGSYQSYFDGLSTSIENLQWLSSLSSLQYLELNYLNLSNAFDWLHVLQSLPSLSELHFLYCDFNNHFQPSIMNFSCLVALELSSSSFHKSLIPKWIFQLKKLVNLQLSNNGFQGSVPNSIQNLTLLQHLDLSENLFNSSMPDWLYKFRSLKSLILSNSNLVGKISSNIGNLTSLVTLDLTRNFLEGSIPSSLGNLCNLKKVDFSCNKFNQQVFEVLKILSKCASKTLEIFYMRNSQLSSHLTDQIGFLKNLVEFDLSENSIHGPIPNSLGNLASLKYLDLSSNAIQGPLPSSLGNLASLKFLDLSSNGIQGPLPSSLGKLTSLIYLYLGNNSIHSAIPISFGKLISLMFLDLSENQFDGNPFEVLGSLSKLSELYLGDNLFHGVVKEAHLVNFTFLDTFFASRNQLTLKVGPNWSPSFQLLAYLEMASWKLGPCFPSWIQSLKHLQYLDMSNAMIFYSIPTWFWGTIDNAQYLNLSHNYIEGELTNILINISGFATVDLSSNKLNGRLPYISQSVTHIDLSRNLFSGPITHFLCPNDEQTNGLRLLNLASNNLSGKIPNCWMMWPSLFILNLENNHFTGILPTSLGSSMELEVLNLRNNRFFGSFPPFSQNNSNLNSLDLGENQFSGMVPSWVGQRFPNLKILVLRTNKFSGPIPHQICDMNSLQILDLAQNELIGHIPKCVEHLSAMLAMNSSLEPDISYYLFDNRYQLVVEPLLLKGRVYDYSTNLGLVTSIDFSSNKLSGEIPIEITRLKGLRFLNLSNNYFAGHIPQTVGNMELLESMDFSMNRLSGEIPPSISKLYFMSKLNLSYNHLIGKIPTGTQLQSFDESSFVGNNLCGPPLLTNCTSNDSDHRDKEADHGNGINWFLVSVGLGFIVGFWVVVGPLLYSRSWRYAYFQFLNRMWYKLQSCCY